MTSTLTQLEPATLVVRGGDSDMIQHASVMQWYNKQACTRDHSARVLAIDNPDPL